MIHSMTGFGEGEATVNDAHATVEMRSVNARHLDLKLRFPEALRQRQSEAEALLKDYVARGRVTVRLQVEEAAEEDAALPVEVDEEAAAAYAALLRRLAAAAGLEAAASQRAPFRLADLLQFSDVLTGRETPALEDETAWQAARQALAAAAAQLGDTRRREGAALHDDLTARLDAIADGLDAVEARAPERVAERRTALRERLGELFDDERVAAARLEAELALTADKLDVTEECVRLRAHLTAFRDALEAEEAAGRRLKFITQELHREANTIGAKANDPALSRHTVAIKEEIEKIREQIRNVE